MYWVAVVGSVLYLALEPGVGYAGFLARENCRVIFGLSGRPAVL